MRPATAALLGAFLFLSLGGSMCATPEPTIRTVEVKIPVAVPCKVDVGPEPQYVDTDAALKAAPDLFARVKLLVAGRLQRIQRDLEKSAALKACQP